jgi:hypothetical protein
MEEILGWLFGGVIWYFIMGVVVVVLYPFETLGLYLRNSYEYVKEGYRGDGVRYSVARTCLGFSILFFVETVLYVFISPWLSIVVLIVAVIGIVLGWFGIRLMMNT